jgi:hypothetical protein
MHNSHPHGEKVMQVHQLNDHLSPKPGKVAKLPDANREDHEAHPYPNEFNPVPTENRGQPHGKRVEPDSFGE